MIKIKPVKQSNSYYCGPAALKMILDYCGVNKSQDVIAKLTGTTSKTGCSKEAMILAAQKLGLKARVKDSASLKDLKAYNNKDVPVIVDWFSDKFEGHYSVVVGFERGKVQIADPYDGKIREIKEQDFVDRWFDFIGPPSKKGLVLRRMIVIEK